VVNLFIEPSTRTRISFELAAIRLSADIINFTAEASSAQKRRDAQRYGTQSGGAECGYHHHPPQRHGRGAFPGALFCAGASSMPAMALMSIRPRPCWTPSPSLNTRGRIAGLNVTILGDILYSRVARSNIWALLKLART